MRSRAGAAGACGSARPSRRWPAPRRLPSPRLGLLLASCPVLLLGHLVSPCLRPAPSRRRAMRFRRAATSRPPLLAACAFSFAPSSRSMLSRRTGLPSLPTTMTFEMAMVPSFSMMPPSALAWLRPFFRWRFTVMSFSTRTRPFSRRTSRTLPRLALLLAGDDLDGVALADLGHGYSTSGAREMIFMNLLARSSRATGPKMRVPIGSLSLLMRTARVAVEADVAAVGALHLAARPHDDGPGDLALLHLGLRDGLLDRDDDDVADARRTCGASRRAP